MQKFWQIQFKVPKEKVQITCQDPGQGCKQQFPKLQL